MPKHAEARGRGRLEARPDALAKSRVGLWLRNRTGFEARGQRSQALVEFALVAPVMLLLGFLSIDVGRLVYTFAAISSAAREGARTASLQSTAQSDCPAIQQIFATANGFQLSMDSNSVAQNSDPNNPAGSLRPQNPPVNQGYVYIWPAVATAAPPESNCSSTAARALPQNARHVAVEIQFHFQPLTPLPNADITVKTVAVERTEY